MTAQIWPFKPREELIEVLEWRTDVFRAKSAEQRIALRTAPRRTFNLTHTLTDYEYASARALIRNAQGGDGFLVPDWPQSVAVGTVLAGSAETITANLADIDMGDTAFLWESLSLFESVNISFDSNGASVDPVTNDYESARLAPLWPAQCPDGLTAQRIGARLNQVSAAFTLTENNDLAASSYAEYRSQDVMPSCPIIGEGNLEESITWPLSDFDNQQSIPEYIRQRDIPNMRFSMRWIEFTKEAQFALRQWIHSRRGQQKAFWFSSQGQDFEPAASVSGTTVTTYALPGFTGVGHSGVFDIDILANDETHYYRRVSVAATGTPIAGRATLDLTIDSTLTLDLADINRISFLRCARFAADRFEFLHRAAGGMSVQVPCIEIEEP